MKPVNFVFFYLTTPCSFNLTFALNSNSDRWARWQPQFSPQKVICRWRLNTLCTFKRLHVRFPQQQAHCSVRYSYSKREKWKRLRDARNYFRSRSRTRPLETQSHAYDANCSRSFGIFRLLYVQSIHQQWPIVWNFRFYRWCSARSLHQANE